MLAILAAVVTVFAKWGAERRIVVGRASLGGPPPDGSSLRRLSPPENLVGRMAGAFAEPDQYGRMAGTTSSRGRVMIVSVWATWCAPCVDELPRIEREIWQELQSDVAVVAIADRQDRTTVDAFNERAKLTFSLIADPSGRIATQFGGRSVIPRTYVVDRSGRIVYQAIGYHPATFPKLVAAVKRAVAASG